jgi:hypothetical protein
MKGKREPIPEVLFDEKIETNISTDEDDDSIPTKFDPEVAKITGLTQEDFDNV